jgi:hypothetical protein
LFGQKKNKGTILFLSMFITRTFEIHFNQLRLAGSHSIMQNPIKTNIRAKLNVFTAISWRGASDLITYNNNLNSDGYCEIINNFHLFQKNMILTVFIIKITHPALPHSPDFNISGGNSLKGTIVLYARIIFYSLSIEMAFNFENFLNVFHQNSQSFWL